MAERLVSELFEGGIVYVPYSRPGFPLARSVSAMVDRIPADAIGLTLAHHGLVVWGDDAEQAHARLRQVVAKIDEYRRDEPSGPAARGPRCRDPLRAGERRRLAEVILPACAGRLSTPDRVILHYDGAADVLSGSPPSARPSSPAAGWRRRSTCFAPGGCRCGSISIRPHPPTRWSPGPEPARGRAGGVRGLSPPSRRGRASVRSTTGPR